MQAIRRTTLDIGRAFEQHSLAFLTRQLHMDLVNVGGAGDGGVDLRGWWDLPLWARTSGNDGQNAASTPARRIRVIAQCKAESKTMGPRAVRELEGVMAHLRGQNRDQLADSDAMVAVLLSQSAFTPNAMTHATRSTTPLLLVHLPGGRPTATVKPEEEEEILVGGAFWNAALAKGVLAGDLELRREILSNSGRHKVTGEAEVKTRVRLWHGGKPLERIATSTPAL